MASWRNGKRLYKIIKHCIDCSKEIDSRSSRCHACARKGKLHPMYGKKHKISSILKNKLSQPDKMGIKNVRYGKKHSQDSIDKMIKKQIKNWKNNPYRKNKKNKVESKLEKILNKIFPKQYKFVGDGKVIIDRYNPDFINCNGQKKIIELYGDYWHNLPNYRARDKRRLQKYTELGYKTLIVWEHELKNIKVLIRNLKSFNGSMV